MFPMKCIHIRSYEMGLLFRRGEFQGLLGEGTHWIFDPLNRVEAEVHSMRTPRLVHDRLDLLVKSGALKPYAEVIDLKDDRRALVWIDGRFSCVLGTGLYVYWAGPRDVRVEIVDARRVRFEHEDLKVIVRTSGVTAQLDICTVERNHAGVLFLDGQYADTLGPGLYAFWRGLADARVVEVDLREATLDLTGQEIMTADKVTLRLNAQVTYVVSDPKRAVCTVDDHRQALYREAQLTLRAVLGARELDTLLSDKDSVSRETEDLLRGRAAAIGLEVRSAGIRDLILPGEMKDLMNKVTEARKAAEANLITRREETAALRSQANTAKLLTDHPALMRLRELEALERIAASGHLNVILGDKGLADRVVNLL